MLCPAPEGESAPPIRALPTIHNGWVRSRQIHVFGPEPVYPRPHFSSSLCYTKDVPNTCARTMPYKIRPSILQTPLCSSGIGPSLHLRKSPDSRTTSYQASSQMTPICPQRPRLLLNTRLTTRFTVPLEKIQSLQLEVPCPSSAASSPRVLPHMFYGSLSLYLHTPAYILGHYPAFSPRSPFLSIGHCTPTPPFNHGAVPCSIHHPSSPQQYPRGMPTCPISSAITTKGHIESPFGV